MPILPSELIGLPFLAMAAVAELHNLRQDVHELSLAADRLLETLADRYHDETDQAGESLRGPHARRFDRADH